MALALRVSAFVGRAVTALETVSEAPLEALPVALKETLLQGDEEGETRRDKEKLIVSVRVVVAVVDAPEEAL